MKSFLLIFFSILLTVIGTGLVAMNVHAITTPILIFSGICIALALALAIPANLEKALVIIMPYAPDWMVGGRRKTDPPAGPTP